jgi:hypothetical protein
MGVHTFKCPDAGLGGGIFLGDGFDRGHRTERAVGGGRDEKRPQVKFPHAASPVIRLTFLSLFLNPNLFPDHLIGIAPLVVIPAHGFQQITDEMIGSSTTPCTPIYRSFWASKHYFIDEFFAIRYRLYSSI